MRSRTEAWPRSDTSPARIAVFVATSGHSGVDRVVANLVRQWAAWGIGVDLLKVRGHGPAIPDPPPGMRLVDLGSRHVYGSLPRAIRYLHRERPLALLADKDRVNRVAILARRLARVDTRLAVRLGTTVSVNLNSRGGWERGLQTRSMRWLYPHADAVLVPSIGAADDLAAFTGLDRDRIQVVRSPIVTPELLRQAAQPASHPWLASHTVPVILGVGELCMRKDFETLVRSFARVRRAGRRCRLIVLGEGGRRERLGALARELGVAEDLDMPGFVANPYAFMAGADLFVLSSRWEGMPVVLIEALACHTPVVATDCPSGPREVLGGELAAGLVPVGDPAAMAAAMAKMLARTPAPEIFEREVAAYRVERSAGGYLRVLGVDRPACGPR